MSELKFDEKTLRAMYSTADPAFKAKLEQIFPEGLSLGNIIDRTPTVEAALAIAGKTIEGLTRPDDAPYETAKRIIEHTIDVLLDGKVVDHSDSNQDKYEPRFIYKAGLGLRYYYCDYWLTATGCGPRLCYLSYDTMVHGVKILEPYYITYLNSKL